jgi:kynurenine formamidase
MIGGAMPSRPLPTDKEVNDYIRARRNWGRWGADDQLGTVNSITPAQRKRAAALVSEGVSVSCSRPISTDITADTTVQPMRFMVDSGEGRDTAPLERNLQRRGAAEFIGMVFHGYTITHVDTPAHYFWNGRMYNGRSCNLITSREGAQVEAVDLLRDGVVSRGVLLDVAALKGRWLEAGEGVMPEDLEAAEKAQGVRVEPGDVLLVRTGYYARRRVEGPRSPLKDGSPAVHVASLPWIRERSVAMLGTDTHNDVSPLPYPRIGNALHVVSLVAMGMWLIDNGNLEELAQACARYRRWQFMLTVAPLVLERVTGSPVNPIAVF